MFVKFHIVIFCQAKKVHVNQSYFRHVSLQHVRHPLLGQQEPSRAVVDVSSTAIEDLHKHNV